MQEARGPARLFVVDDEPAIVELHEMALSGDYDVETAYGGPEALEVIDRDPDFDLALVDRRMPRVSGDEVIERLREVSPECRVVMVTAVEPDFDVVDLPFDEYLVKPVTRDAIRETVQHILRLKRYREQCRREYALASKVAALRAHKQVDELRENEEYRGLVQELADVRASLDDTIEGFTNRDFTAAYAEIDGVESPVSPGG